QPRYPLKCSSRYLSCRGRRNLRENSKKENITFCSYSKRQSPDNDFFRIMCLRLSPEGRIEYEKRLCPPINFVRGGDLGTGRSRLRSIGQEDTGRASRGVGLRARTHD